MSDCIDVGGHRYSTIMMMKIVASNFEGLFSFCEFQMFLFSQSQVCPRPSVIEIGYMSTVHLDGFLILSSINY